MLNTKNYKFWFCTGSQDLQRGDSLRYDRHGFHERESGGAHRTVFTYDLNAEQMGDWANAMGIEAVYIDRNTNIRDFKKDLMIGSVYYR